MQKKHLVGYPIVALVWLSLGAATSQSPAGAPAVSTPASVSPAAAVTHTARADTSPATTATVMRTADAAPAPTSAVATTIPGDGTYEVGIDIEPGKYTSDVPAGGNCYWARLKSDDPFDGIIANNNSSGMSVVVVKKSDTYFQSTGCSDWTKR